MKLALVLEKEDDPFLPYIKPLLAGHQATAIYRPISTAAEISAGFDGVITTREDLLRRLTFKDGRLSIDNYSGSLFHKDGKPFLILDPLRHLIVTPTGQFLAKRYIRKITHPNEWFPQSKFTWELADEVSVSALYDQLATADLIAIDIETTRGAPHIIRCVGYCGVWFGPNNTFRTHSIVLPYTSMFWVEWVRKYNDLPIIKIFQNGLFDNQYFNRFSSPVKHWLLDTMEMFHCWYSELPKTLDYITLFLLRDVYYWKDEADSGELHDLYLYNAKDVWATANSMLSLLSEMPDYVKENYKQKFPVVFPCLACSFEGVKVDEKKVDPNNPESLYNVQAKKVEASLSSLQAKIGKPGYNPGSPKQTLQLVHTLDGPKNFSSTDEKSLKKFAKKHPLNNLIVDEILKYREAKKLVSTYLGAQLWGGRALYSLHTSGTDTGRLASRKSSFSGYGLQIQNIPPYFKQVAMADDGFYLGEADNKQSEAYCLGYLSGDENLIETLNSGRDFHSVNIERFFGTPYEEVWDSILNKTKNKDLRDLSKRVNHGTAYVMGALVLLETMGLENVIKAQKLLSLPVNWKPVEVCQYLLDRYHLAYPRVKQDYYEWVKAIVKMGNKLVSALGWTRYCFSDPSKGGHAFKMYVAHCPQNLSVGIINRAFVKVFYELQIPHWKDFRLKAQIHDSIFFQYRIGRLDLALKARELIEQTIPVKDVKGKIRDMRIPVDLKAEAIYWSDIKSIHV